MVCIITYTKQEINHHLSSTGRFACVQNSHNFKSDRARPASRGRLLSLFRAVLNSACSGHCLGEHLYCSAALPTLSHTLQTHGRHTDKAHKSQSRRPDGCTAPSSGTAGTSQGTGTLGKVLTLRHWKESWQPAVEAGHSVFQCTSAITLCHTIIPITWDPHSPLRTAPVYSSAAWRKNLLRASEHLPKGTELALARSEGWVPAPVPAPILRLNDLGAGAEWQHPEHVTQPPVVRTGRSDTEKSETSQAKRAFCLAWISMFRSGYITRIFPWIRSPNQCGAGGRQSFST